MKKLGKFKLFGLLIFLSVALVFVGINFLEAKRKPEVQWKVAIPTLGEALEKGYNLYGVRFNSNGEFVDDDTHVIVSCEKRSGKNPYYLFKLRLYNTNTWEDPCTGGDEYYNSGDYTVGFQDITLTNVVYTGDGVPCLFPPMNEPDTVCWDTGAPSCIHCFLNEWEHPSSWACMWCDNHQRLENRGYRDAYIQIKIFDDIEEYTQGVAVNAEIGLYISVDTGVILGEGQDFWHDIEIHRPENVTYVANVTRLGEDSWEIIFNLDEETVIVFEETYKESVGEVQRKGKSSGYHYNYVEHTPVIATADQFSFKTTWTRFKKIK